LQVVDTFVQRVFKTLGVEHKERLSMDDVARYLHAYHHPESSKERPKLVLQASVEPEAYSALSMPLSSLDRQESNGTTPSGSQARLSLSGLQRARAGQKLSDDGDADVDIWDIFGRSMLRDFKSG